MRNVFLSAAAAFAIVSPAVAETNGSVGLDYDQTSYGSYDAYETFTLNGSVFHGIAGNWGVQADGRYEQAEYDGGYDEDATRYAVHGLYRTGQWGAGLTAGQGEIFGADVEYLGLEGAFYLQSWTFTGTALLGELSADYDRYRVGATYFIGENLSVGGGYATAEYGTSDWDTLDIGVEYRFGAMPLVLSGGYAQSDMGYFDEPGTWTLGVRWDFGTESLRDADRTGPMSNDSDGYFADLRRWD